MLIYVYLSQFHLFLRKWVLLKVSAISVHIMFIGIELTEAEQ